MNVEQATLANGITIITAPMPTLHSVSIVFYFRIGSRYESEAEAGMCHFIEHMLFKGTKRYPTARAVSEAIENYGGDFNGSTGKESTDYSVKISSDYVDRAFDLLTDLVRQPLFAANEVEKERRVIAEELHMYKDSPQDWVHVLLDEILFPDSALGREVVGTPESLKSITRPQIVAFFQQHYIPANLVVSVAGNITPAAAVDHLQTRLGTWQGGAAVACPPAHPPLAGPYITIEQRATEQVNLCLAFPAVGHADPDHDTAALLNAILGDGMSSRLFQSIREEQGLAYDVSSSSTNFHETGSFEITVGCDPERTDAVLLATLAELRKLCAEPPSATELQRIKDYTRGRFVIGLEDTYSVAAWWGSQLALHGQTRTVEDILARIASITPADVQRVAQRIFRTEGLRMAAIGPLPSADHFRPLLKI